MARTPVQDEIASLLDEMTAVYGTQMQLAEEADIHRIAASPAPRGPNEPRRYEPWDPFAADRPPAPDHFTGREATFHQFMVDPSSVSQDQVNELALTSRSAQPRRPDDRPPPWAPVRQQAVDRGLSDPAAARWLREYARHKTVVGEQKMPDPGQITEDFSREFDRTMSRQEINAAVDYFTIFRNARRLMDASGIDGRSAHAARNFPLRHRGELLRAVDELVHDRRPYEDQLAIEKVVKAVVRGGIAAPLENIGDTLGVRGLTDDDRAFVQAIRGAVAGDPSVAEAPWLERTGLQALEMGAQQVGGLASAAVAGPAGMTAYWYAQMYPDAYQEMVDAGVPADRARIGATISAGLQSVVEQMNVNPFQLKGAVRNLKQAAIRWTGQAAMETSEEGIQKAIQEIVLDASKGLSPDVNRALLAGMAEMKATAPSIALMMAPAGARGAMDVARRPARFADAVERRNARQADTALGAFATAGEGVGAMARRALPGSMRTEPAAATAVEPTTLSLATPPAAPTQADRSGNKRGNNSRGKTLPTRDELFDDLEGWARSNPEAAARIAKHLRPSQSQVGDIVSGRPLNAKARQTLSERLRDVLDNQKMRPISHMNAAEQRGADRVKRVATDRGTLPTAGPVGDFFETGDADEIVPVSKLISYKDEAQDSKFRKGKKQDARLTAMEAMQGTQAGLAEYGGKPLKKRAPLTVRALADGSYTVLDGNATAQAAMLIGQAQVPVKVVNDEGLIELLNQTTKSKDARNILKFYTQRDPAELKRLARRIGMTLPAGSWESMRDAILLETFGKQAEEGLQKRIAEAPAIKAKYDRAMSDLANALDLEYMAGPIKGVERARHKVVHDYDADVDQLTDVVRGSLVLRQSQDGQTLQTVADVVARIAETYPVLKYKNRIRTDQPSPQDVLMVVDVDGSPVELQIHLPEVIKAKETHHKNYERWRTLDAKFAAGDETAADLREMVALDREMMGAYAEALDAFNRRTNSSLETGPPSDLSVAIEKGVGSSGSDISQAPTQALRSGVSSTATGLPPASQKTVVASGNSKSSIDQTLPAMGGTSTNNIPQKPVAVTEKTPPPASTPGLRRADMTPEQLDAWLEAQINDRLPPAEGAATPAKAPEPTPPKPKPKAPGRKRRAAPPAEAPGRAIAGHRKGDVVKIDGVDYKVARIVWNADPGQRKVNLKQENGLGFLTLAAGDFERKLGRPDVTPPPAPADSPPGAKPAKRKRRQKPAEARPRKAAVEKRLEGEIADLVNYLDGKTFSGIDPKLVGLTAKILRSYTELGILKFADAVRKAAEQLPAHIERIAEAFQVGWQALSEIDDRLDPAGDVRAVLLERQIADGGVAEPQEDDDGASEERQPAAGDAVRNPGDEPLAETPAAGDAGPGEPGAGGDAGGGGAGGGGVSAPAKRDGRRRNGPRGGNARVRPAAGSGQRTAVGRARDHRIEPGDLERRSFKPKERFRDNVAAITLLKQIEAEDRRATPDEQKVLAKYVGWGGRPQAFEDATGKWTAEIAELKALLTDEEYAAARASTPNAHYTSPEVIRGLWAGIEAAGFKGGRILEPAAGVGHFFGLMPPAIREQSRLDAVELDSISGRVTRQLYQSANVEIRGYQEVKQGDGTFDLTISNVPFANVKITDPFDRGLTNLQASLHDYYFSKAIRKTRPGGLVVFLTSRYTLDKGIGKLRKDWGDRADFIGAVRLPETAFRGSSGTDVVTDALIFQRRADGAEPGGEAFARTVRREIDGHSFDVNEYYTAHPENILGQEKASGTMYAAAGYNVEARSGLNLEQAIGDRIGRMTFDTAALDAIATRTKDARKREKKQAAQPEAAIDVAAMAEGGVAVDLKEQRLLQKQNGELVPVHIPYVGMGGPGVKGAANRLRRIKDLVGLAPLGRRLIRIQQDPDADDAAIAEARKALNDAYDAVTRKWGPINNQTNRTMLSPAYADLPFLMSLENWDDATETAKKADIFSKRVQFPVKRSDRADSPGDALAISLAERGSVDIAYMAQLTGKSEAEITDALAGTDIFKNPESQVWEPAALYLAGNVRAKLEVARKAAAIGKEFAANVTALEAVIPEDLLPGQIAVRLGSPWIPASDYATFIQQVLNHQAEVYVSRDGTWRIARLDGRLSSALDIVDYGIPEMPAMKILEKILNQRDIKVWVEGTGDSKILDARLTQAAAGKANELKRRFAEWLWEDEARTERLIRSYNDLFNNTVIPQYDGSHLTLPGLTAEIQAELNAGERPYRKNAIWRMIANGNTLVGHAVGAGKTITAAGMCMEMRRLGRWKKPVLTVPNHLVSQWPAEFLRAYPDAKILAATEDDFTPQRRQALMNRIATGDWDAIIVPHTSFEKMPLRPEIQEEFYRKEMADLEQDIREAKASSGDTRNFVKDLERQLQALEEKLKKLSAAWKRDPGPYFDELGIDALLVDESQAFKNTFFRTKMNRVPGVAPKHTQRSFDMLMKTRFLNNRSQYRGVVFMTGTPITNSLAEMFALQHYLRPDLLADRGIEAFDKWANVFGEVVAQAEIAPDGSGVRMHSRFAKFANLPELTQMYRTYADIVTGEQLGIPRPRIAGGKAETVKADRSPQHKAIVDSLVQRMEAIRTGQVKPDEDNALAVTNDGRSAALDLRLYDPNLPDLPDSKLNQCVERVFGIWEQGHDAKSTQLIWLDQGTPGKKGKTAKAGVNLYADIKRKLVERGVPDEQIAFIHDAGKDAKKKLALYDRVNRGEVRILIGSTGKMGTGANVQKRLIAAHHLDPPWRPADLEQRDGRIIRFGNSNEEIQLYRYVTQGTFDAYMWQTLETKARFLAQVNQGDPTVREAEDVAPVAFDYAEVKAMAASDPRILDFARLQNEVQQMAAENSQHLESQTRLKRSVAYNRQRLAETAPQEKRLAATVEKVDGLLEAKKDSGVNIDGVVLEKHKEAGERITEIARDYQKAVDAAFEAGDEPPVPPATKITVLGFPAHLELGKVDFESVKIQNPLHLVIDVDGMQLATSNFGDDAVGNANRIFYPLRQLGDDLKRLRSAREMHEKNIADATPRIGKPYAKADELADKQRKLAALQAALMGNAIETASILKSDVYAAFPGSTVTAVDGGYRVELANGQFFDITMDNTIDVEDWDAVEKALGREIPEDERVDMLAAGRFEVHAGDRSVNGIGLMRLASGEATSEDLRHEAVHLARAAGLFSDGEWHALVRRYSSHDADPAKQEEDIARAAEAWKRDGWGQRVRAYLRELLDRFGIKEIDGDSVAILFGTESFWRRPARDAEGDAAAGGMARYSVRQRRRRPMPANPVLDPIARDLVREVDRVWQVADEPQRRSDDSVVTAAERRLDADYAGERQRILDVANAGGSLTDVETLIAKSIIEDEAPEAVRSGDLERIMEAKAFIDAYRRTGTEEARAFRQRRDPLGTPSQRRARVIVESLLTPPESVQQKIEAARGVDPDAVRRLQAQWFQRILELKHKLAKMGIDLDRIEALASDEIASLKVVKAISTMKASGWDKLYEYWQNAILSAPTTHMANIIGNTVNATWDLTAQRLVEAIVNVGVRDSDAATFGEFRYMLGGLLPGISRGARNFLRSWLTESAYFEREIGTGDGSTSKLDTRQPAIAGRKGGIVRAFGYRPLMAADEFFKSVIGEVEAGAYAYRIAKRDGLKGDALRRRIAALVADTDSEAWHSALGRARELTFQRDLGKAGKAVLKLRRDVPFLRYVMPFVTTPANIFKTGLRKTPLNTPVVIAKALRNRSLKGLAPEIAEQMLAWAAVLALMGLIDDDEGQPRITGTRDELSYGKRTTARRALPAQSIRINGRWYSYGRIEPIATALGVTVDWLRALRSGDAGEIASGPFESLVGQVKNKSFLSGLGDLLRALEAEGSDERLIRWASSFTTSFVPNIAKSALRSADEDYSERGVWGEGGDWLARLGRRTMQRAEIPGIGDEPFIDVWGRESPRSRSPVFSGPVTDWIYRLVVPINNQEARMLDADRMLVNWNLQNPSDEWNPIAPSKRYEDETGEHYMSDAQYTEYARLSGRAAALLAGFELGDAIEKPVKADIERMASNISAARSMAREALVKQWNGKQGPIDTARQIAEAIHDKHIVAAAEAVSRPKPPAVAKWSRWRQEREAAQAWLQRLGVDRSKAYETYKAHLRKTMRNPQSIIQRLGRLNQGWPKRAA